jgi:hypothetical protein
MPVESDNYDTYVTLATFRNIPNETAKGSYWGYVTPKIDSIETDESTKRQVILVHIGSFWTEVRYNLLQNYLHDIRRDLRRVIKPGAIIEYFNNMRKREPDKWDSDEAKTRQASADNFRSFVEIPLGETIDKTCFKLTQSNNSWARFELIYMNLVPRPDPGILPPVVQKTLAGELDFK